jgi:hypothetical protein
MMEGILIVVAPLYSAALAAIGRRLPRPASMTAYSTALATLVAVLLLSKSMTQWVDDLVSVVGAGRLLFYVALMAHLCGLILMIILATHQWRPTHWWALGGAGVLTGWYVGLWLRVKMLDLPDMAAVFSGRRAGDSPAILWMHIVTGVGVVYMAAWGLMAFLTFLRGARSTYEQGIAGVAVVLYLLTGLSGLCTVVEAVGHYYAMDIAVVDQMKSVLKIVLPAGGWVS